MARKPVMVGDINENVAHSLVHWAAEIMGTYMLGNKEQARAMFQQVPADRRAFVTMHIMIDSDDGAYMEAACNFICSVTK